MMEKRLLKFRSKTAFIVSMTVFASICFSGCVPARTVVQDDPFKVLYASRPPASSIGSSGASVASTASLSLSCCDMPVSVLFRIMSDKFSVGLVYSETLSDSRVTAEFKETDLESVLNVVARQLSVDVVRVGNTFFIGSLRPEDRGVLVRRVAGFADDSLKEIVTSILSTNGKVSAFQSVVFCTDHESVLRRVAESLDYLDAVDYDVWIVQLAFISLRKDMLVDAGLGVTSSGTISYDVANSTVDVKNLTIDALMNLSASSSFADIWMAPMFICRDGTTSKWQDGKRVPIPRKTVSEYGTVSVTGYDYVDTGFIVSCRVDSCRVGGRISVSVEQSEITGYVEAAPTTSTTKYDFQVDMAPSKLYLLGELSGFRIVDKTKEVLTFGTDRGKSTVQVWAQLYRIAPAGALARPAMAR